MAENGKVLFNVISPNSSEEVLVSWNLCLVRERKTNQPEPLSGISKSGNNFQHRVHT